MGVSGKWIRALVGLKKSEKSQSSEKDENRTAASKSRHRRKHSVEIDTDKLQYEFNHDAAPPVGDSNTQSNPDVAVSHSGSLQGQVSAHNEQSVREEWAAMRIQTAFRGFLVLLLYIILKLIQSALENHFFVLTLHFYSRSRILFLSIHLFQLSC
jgi:hypothetical protein